MSQESALGGACLAFDWIQIKNKSKLDSVTPGSVEAYYMLAAYVFDLVRKHEYVFKATREFALRADPKLAAEIKRDNESLDALSGKWEAAARKAEEIMLRLYREVGEEHERLLNQVAGQRK